jgi:hypothetical protein
LEDGTWRRRSSWLSRKKRKWTFLVEGLESQRKELESEAFGKYPERKQREGFF